MEGDEFLDEEVLSNVQRYEKMLRNKSKDYFDAETLELIVEFYINKEKYKKAMEVVYYAEELYPGYISFMIQKADLLGAMGKYNEALEVVEKAELYEPFNVDLLLLKGDLLLNLESTAEAAECFERILLNTDDRVDMLFEIAYIYQDCELTAKALEYFSLILKENPDNEQAHYEIANCHELLGRFDLSMETYRQLVDQDPYSANAWYNLGLSYTRLEDHEHAIEAFDYCLLLEDDYPSAKLNRANALVETGKFEEGITLYNELLEKEGPDSITYCNLAACYERMENHPEAREYYKKAAKLNANIPDAWFGIGITLIKESQHKEALQHFKRAVLLEPENVIYQLSLAETTYRLGNFEEAEETYKKILELAPDSVEAWLDWSVLHFCEGQLITAIELMQEAIKSDPDCDFYHYRMACYLYEAGKKEEAKSELEMGLLLRYENHKSVFEFMPKLSLVPEFMQLIELYARK